jgi:S1 RNA binding domain protein
LAIEVGSVLEGKVTGIKNFGAFVALPEGKTGLVHISEVSNEFIQDLHTVLQEGQTVNVKVMSIAPDGKIALSIKRLLPPPPRGAGRPDSRPHTGNGGFHGGNGSFHGGSGGFHGGNGGGFHGGNGGGRRGGPRSGGAPHVWDPKSAPACDNLSFEDMMDRFKNQSEEKMADLDREVAGRRGGGYAPRGHKK